MNFVYPDGRPSMPELTWDYGYLYFWLLAGALFVCLISYFKFVKRWL
jgi:magnesium transporter